MSKNAETTPMDPSAQEVSGTNRVSSNTARNVYAMDTLIAEVLDLFPETVVETNDVDGRNAAHTVGFSVEGREEKPILLTILELLVSDPRILSVGADDEVGLVWVAFTHNARLKDSREPFNLSAAFSVLIEQEDGSL